MPLNQFEYKTVQLISRNEYDKIHPEELPMDPEQIVPPPPPPPVEGKFI